MAEGPFLALPAERADAIVVERFTESMGDLRRAVHMLVEALPPGGGIVFDLSNLQSPQSLRRVLEGRPGSLDPAGSLRDPDRPVLLHQFLEACDTAGLLVSDVYRVPPAADELGDDFARAMFDQGFLATACVGGPPPARFWVVARRQPCRVGSVLVGAGAPAEQSRTESVLRSFLPQDWEIVTCPGEDELESFNRGVALSTGETLWFLRAGATPDATLFHNLVAASFAAPAAPQAADEVAGAFCGLMARREIILGAGPLSRSWQSPAIAYEEYALRLSTLAVPTVPVVGTLTCPPLPVADADVLAREADTLIETWKPILDRPFRGERTEAERTTPVHEAPWQDREPRTTLCMIARNEERFLADCILSARAAVDEIVVVDTGSTDRTVEIAESLGAVVLHEPWNDDFASPRNKGLEAATGDWVLVLDADERLVDGAAENIRELVQDAGVCGYHMIMRNIYDGEQTQGVRMVRLFRNLPEVRWQNRIHEQVTPTLTRAGTAEGLVLSSSDVVIEHVGYGTEIMVERGKDERNERIFRAQLAEQPNDIYTLYKFGDFLRRLPDGNVESLSILERGLEQVYRLAPHQLREIPYAAEIAALCALEHAREDRLDLADEICERAFSCLMPTPNLHYIAAGLALHRGHHDEAIAHYRQCLRYADQVLVVPIQDGITGHVSLTGIAQAWLQKGEHQKARRMLEMSQNLCPTYEVTALALSRLHFELGDVPASLHTLMDFLTAQPDSAGACQQATLILSKIGMTDEARTMGKRAIALLEKDSQTTQADKMRQTLAALS